MRSSFPVLSLFLMLLSLSACTSVPPSSFGRLAALSPLEAKPDELKVALLAPGPLVMKSGDAVLTIGWTAATGESHSENFPLDVLDGNAGAPQLMSRLGPGQRMYVLRLAKSDIEPLLELQRTFSLAKSRHIKGRGNISLGFRNACWDGSFPAKGEPLPISAYIRTASGDDFIPLLDEIEIRDILKMGNLTSLPDCAGTQVDQSTAQ